MNTFIAPRLLQLLVIAARAAPAADAHQSRMRGVALQRAAAAGAAIAGQCAAPA